MLHPLNQRKCLWDVKAQDQYVLSKLLHPLNQRKYLWDPKLFIVFHPWLSVASFESAQVLLWPFLLISFLIRWLELHPLNQHKPFFDQIIDNHLFLMYYVASFESAQVLLWLGRLWEIKDEVDVASFESAQVPLWPLGSRKIWSLFLLHPLNQRKSFFDKNIKTEQTGWV